ncbi:MAG: sulfatase-like hydrolase/transferase [Acidobacteria bacterium]|nr:sulfatase-like hydrolase/transferase [Acidobacteriota bacterium]
MLRRQFLQTGLAAAVPAPARERMNVLLITDDQHNARNLGCYGDPFIRTPNLDRLARRGVRFSRAYSQGMICAPSRVTMMTGQYVHSHGYYGNWGAHSARPLWLSSYLRRNGYQTALVGKAHYGYEKTAAEFDYFRLCDRADIAPDRPLTNDYFRMLLEHGRPNDHDVLISQRKGVNVPFRSLLPKELSLEWWTGDVAIDFLRKRDRSKPFFAHVSFQRPHAPITPPAPYDTMYHPAEVKLPPSANEDLLNKPAEQLAAAKRSAYPYHPTDKRKLQEIMAMYFGLITSIDDNVGRVLAELDAQNLTGKTLVIFTSDHGDFSGEHGFFHKNLGMYEAIQRIPFLMAGPGIAGGQERNELVEQTDIYPTVCDCAGLSVPDSVQGLSLTRMEKWPRTAAFGEIEKRKCVRTARYRMVFDPLGPANELYDHDADPWEMVNQYDNPAFKDVRLALMDEFMRFYARTEQQTITTSSMPKRRVDMPPGPTRDLWWSNMDWEVVKKKYRL